MHGKFFYIVTLFSLILMILIVCFAFKSVSNVSDENNSAFLEKPAAIVAYGRKALNEVKSSANSVLNTFGFTIDGEKTADEVTKHLQKAGLSVNEAVKEISK